jgi:3-hydroxyacyl-CoA dehydrogenase
MSGILEQPTDGNQIAERLVERLLASIHLLLVKGASPFEIDQTLVGFGFAMGPLETQDLVGLEASYKSRKSSGVDRKSRKYLESGMMISDRMVQEGRLGKIAGVGWYRYPGGKGKVEDPLLEDLIREEAYFAGIEQKSFSTDEIVPYVLSATANEMKIILGETASISLSELDQIAVKALGFPHEKGSLLDYGSGTSDLVR